MACWEHINLLGEYDFSDERVNTITKFDFPKILELEVAYSGTSNYMRMPLGTPQTLSYRGTVSLLFNFNRYVIIKATK